MKKSKKYVVSIILNIVLFIGLIALMFHYGAFGSITSKLNNKIENISQISGVKYINLYPNFVKENKMSGDYTRDGLHLNEECYQNLEKLLEPYL